MNLSQIRSAVDARTGIAQNPTLLAAAINEAVQIISTERDWSWLDGVSSFTTTSGTASYALPADWAETRSMTIGGFQARNISAADGDTYDNYEDVTSPYSYAIEGGYLVIYPTPQAVAVIHRYVKTEPTLAADTDSPLLPPRFHVLIADLVAASTLDRLDPKRAGTYRTQYERGLKRMIQTTRRASQPGRIRVRPGGML